MNWHSLTMLCALGILTGLLLPAAGAVDPLWTERASTGGELSGVVISADGSTIVAGGDQLIALSRNGKKLWTGWSGASLVISRKGDYILTSRDQTVRMISGTGTMLWDESLGVPVTDMAMTPDASLIAAGGGSRVRLMYGSGAGFRLNTTIPLNHIRLFPDGTKVVITTKNGIQISNLTLFSEWTDTNMTQDLVEVASDGSSFVTVTNNRVRLYTGNGDLQWDRALPGGNALALAYSHDGSTIVIGRDDNTVQVLNHIGTLLWTAPAAHWITSVAVSDDGNTIAAGSMDKTLSLYDRAGTKLGSFTAANPIKAHSVAVSGDGSLIAAVDASAVYGFSRSQFMQPQLLAQSTVTLSAPVTTLTRVTTTSTAPPPYPVSSGTGTPQAPPQQGVPLVVLALMLLWRSRSS
jgi:WD40 repeat protein